MLSLQNVGPPLPHCFSSNGGARALLCYAAPAAAAASDLCDPQRGVQDPGSLWGKQINPLHVLNPALSTHYLSHSLTGGWC